MTVMDYRTQDGLADYGFSIEFQSDVGWRVYIIFEPSHQDHDDRLKSPYQSIDGDERRYVDWSPKLDNIGEAKRLPEFGRSLSAPGLVAPGSGPGEGTNPGCRVRPAREQLDAPTEAKGRPVERRSHGGTRQRPLTERAGALPHPRGHDDLRPCSQRQVRPEDRLLDLPARVQQQQSQR